MKDGLVLKVSEFNDYDRTYSSLNNAHLTSDCSVVNELTHVTYSYEHRHDKLDVREHDLQTNTVYETYRPGRTDRVKGRRMAMPLASTL